MAKPRATQEFPAAPYWSLSIPDLLAALKSTRDGLSADEAQKRLIQTGPNILKPRRHDTAFRLLISQFTSPLVLILIFAAAVSAIASEWADTAIVLTIVAASSVLSFTQEYLAGNAVEKLRSQVTMKTAVLRDGQDLQIPSENIVPGDIVLLSAGCLIPADGIVLEANDFFVSQSVLTGETFPVEKKAGQSNEDAELQERTGMVFMGTSVRSGTARILIVETGTRTAFGKIAERLTLRPPETEFERGITRFGFLLTQIMTALVVAVFVINTLLSKPVIDSLLFAIALAVGIAPELLPAIIGISLSKGATDMAKKGVIVRRLNSIENLGSMDTLCTDKTGTLTEGVVHLDGALDVDGQPSEDVLRWSYLNAFFQTGIINPLDESILTQAPPDIAGASKLAEIPYDFIRKRLSVIVDMGISQERRPFIITKGALESILSVCAYMRSDGAAIAVTATQRGAIEARFSEWSMKGYRVLGVAVRDVPLQSDYTASDNERDMTFVGFLLFFDPPKSDVCDTIAALKKLGVHVKIITGDNQLVARHVAEIVGIPSENLLTSHDLDNIRDEALWNVAERTSIFAEVDPNQKERIILALRKMGHVVGFMGDGINDAPALHSADVGISVDKAVDVAKEAADFVLLQHDLSLVLEGIKEGRRTFANTMKYVFTTTSANFGNMLSMAGASLFLPFLPLLAKQILLNNFLSDFPAAGIPGDNVDEEMVLEPHRWNIRFIRSFMIIFGLVSSVFDYATFGLLLFVLHATEKQFQTGWFIESLLTELVIALVVRTRRPFFRSRPGKILWAMSLSVSLITLAVPYLPFSGIMGFTPLPAWVMAALVSITVLYIAAAEIMKKIFYRHFRL